MEIAIALVVIAAALAVLVVLLAAKKEIIKIGAIVSVSSPGSYKAEDVREGMLMAANESNSWDGTNGRKIELTSEDNKTDPQEGKEEGFTYPQLFGDIDVKAGQHNMDFRLHPAQIVKGEVKYLP